MIKLSATEAVGKIRNGEITSRELVQACLDRIAEFEATIGAWAHLDADHALDQAKRADEDHAKGLATGPLHGVPVGVKDIIDTADFPTENGTVLHSGRTPDGDATLVARLREAGAVDVVVAADDHWALMHEHRGAPEPSLDELAALMDPVDILLVEGFKQHDHDKIEVHRRATGKPLLCLGDPNIVAIASDEPVDGVALPRFDLDDVAAIADFIVGR